VVYVRDVARVELGAQTYDQTNTADGQPSTSMAVYLLPGANALEVADAIKQRMKELKSRFPPGLDYDYYYDTTPFIQRSVEEVVTTLLIAVLLVGCVVLFFLQDWKAMILPMIDVPVSLVGTFAVMAALGICVNLRIGVFASVGSQQVLSRSLSIVAGPSPIPWAAQWPLPIHET
jgi:multidrug efflux pump